MSKQANPKINDTLVDKPVPQGKRRKGITACADKRRSGNFCGICGSPDIVWSGIAYCGGCKQETEFELSVDVCWGIPRFNSLKCKCLSYTQSLYTITCLACRATFGPLCLNCKSPHWSHCNTGKHYCTHCGFRIN